MKFDEVARSRLAVLLFWLSLAAASGYLLLFEPGKNGFFLACPFRKLTGFTCPGCGSTRALHRLIHGDVVAAFQFNPLFVLALPLLLYVLLRYTNAAVRGKPINPNQLSAKYIWVLFVVILSFWIFRNTPFYPFIS
jgi:Protein of unknown function (DUF2752)